MHTTALNTALTEECLEGLTKDVQSRTSVRVASVNKRTKRVSFSLTSLDRVDVVVAVVCQDQTPTGSFYVLPASVCPEKLEFNPEDRLSKWEPYRCEKSKLKHTIAETCKFKTNKLLANLSP